MEKHYEMQVHHISICCSYQQYKWWGESGLWPPH